LLDFGVRHAHGGAWGVHQYLAVAPKKGCLYSAFVYLCGPVMERRWIGEIELLRAFEMRQGGEFPESRLLRLASHLAPGVQVSAGENDEDQDQDRKIRSPEKIQAQ
jgi:hypothetical protein